MNRAKLDIFVIDIYQKTLIEIHLLEGMGHHPFQQVWQQKLVGMTATGGPTAIAAVRPIVAIAGTSTQCDGKHRDNYN